MNRSRCVRCNSLSVTIPAMIVAGIDEAGYGPLLGPLVISAAAFRVPATPDMLAADSQKSAVQLEAGDIWGALQAAITARPPVRSGKLIVADSKAVHALADGPALLERTTLAFTHLLGGISSSGANVLPSATTLQQLLLSLGQPPAPVFQQPWYQPDGPLPRFGSGAIGPAANFLARTLYTADIAVVALRTRVITEHEFNRLVAVTNNKAAVLIGATFAHLSHLYNQFAAENLLVIIDKQGGRDHYLDLLLETFPEEQIKVLAESKQSSSYVITGGHRQATIYFLPKAESASFATALASMICKYLREVLMNDFNHWFQLLIPSLAATAGYYQDGQRWLRDVSGHLPRIGLEPAQFLRIR